MNDHPSNSAVQKYAETELLRILSQRLKCTLEPHNIKLNNKSSIQIDGFSAKNRILCEVYSHIGPLRGGQPDKIAADILKLNLAEKRKGGKWRKILLFADESACKYLRGSSWLSEICKEGRIYIEVVEASEEIMEKITAAQQRQKMVNKK